MRSMYFKLALFVLAIYLPWLAIVKLGRSHYFDDDFASWQYKFALADEDKEKFNPPHVAAGDCLTLVSILPNKIDPKIYNLGMSGATPVETYFLLKRYLESGKKPERVYVMFGMTHFQLSDSLREYTLPFGVLTVTEQLTLMNDIRIHGSPIKEDPHWLLEWGNGLLTFLGLDSETAVAVRKRFFTQFHKVIEKKLALMKETKGQHYFPPAPETVMLPSPLVDYDHLSFDPLIYSYFLRTLDLLRDHKIQTVVDFVPNNSVTWDKWTPTFLKEWQEFRQTIKQKYPEVILGDISAYPPEYFSDFDHMNQEGAEKYSEEFRRRYYGN